MLFEFSWNCLANVVGLSYNLTVIRFQELDIRRGFGSIYAFDFFSILQMSVFVDLLMLCSFSMVVFYFL